MQDIQSSLDLSLVNFNKIEEVAEYAGRLIDLSNSLGVLSCEKRLQSREAIVIYQAAKGWVNTVKKQMLTMSPGESLRLIDTYEIMHRIAYCTSPNVEEMNRIKLTSFDAMIHGDKDVDEYIMFRTIRKAVSQRDKAFFDKPLSWSCMALERWYKEAVKGYDNTMHSDYDIQSRINILLESDLYAYAGRNQDQFKKSLIEKHKQNFETYDNANQ